MNRAKLAPQRRRRERRSVKLILPSLQLRLIGWFAGTAATAFLAQALLLSSRLTKLVARMPEGGGEGNEGIGGLVRDHLLFSFGMLLPAVLLIGILATFRIAGPIYRFKAHLRAVADGVETGPCRLRRGDQLGDLCELINAALERARARGGVHPDAVEASAPACEEPDEAA